MIILKIIGILFLTIILFILGLIVYSIIVNSISFIKHYFFLKQLDGKSMFISTNKKNFSDLNESVLDNLDKDIIVVKLVAGKVDSRFETNKIHRLINKERLKGFPIGLKINKGKLKYKSFNHDYKTKFSAKEEYLSISKSVNNWFKKF